MFILQFKEREEKVNCLVLYHTFDRNVAGIVVSVVDQDNIFIYWTAKTIRTSDNLFTYIENLIIEVDLSF